jgi:hypothetical protein
MTEESELSKTEINIGKIILGKKVKLMADYLDSVIDEAYEPMVLDGMKSLIIRMVLLGIASGILGMAILAKVNII